MQRKNVNAYMAVPLMLNSLTSSRAPLHLVTWPPSLCLVNSLNTTLFGINAYISFVPAVLSQMSSQFSWWYASVWIPNSLSVIPLQCTYHASLSVHFLRQTLTHLSVTLSFGAPPSPTILRELAICAKQSLNHSTFILLLSTQSIIFKDSRAKMTGAIYTSSMANEIVLNFPPKMTFFVLQGPELAEMACFFDI